jgi:hypothetical protein
MNLEPWGHIDGTACHRCGVRYKHHGWLAWQWHALLWCLQRGSA